MIIFELFAANKAENLEAGTPLTTSIVKQGHGFNALLNTKL